MSLLSSKDSQTSRQIAQQLSTGERMSRLSVLRYQRATWKDSERDYKHTQTTQQRNILIEGEYHELVVILSYFIIYPSECHHKTWCLKSVIRT